MITNRIYQLAHLQPTKPAVISNDATLRYIDFARGIELARSFFEQQRLPAGQTAIVLPSTLLDAWVFVMALRALGLTTACVQFASDAEALKLRNVACIVLSEDTAEASNLKGTSLERIKAIVVPSAVFSNLRTGDPPPHSDHAPPFGGHILLTSGTTGATKKVFFDGNYEDKRIAAWAHVYPFNKSMVYHVRNLGPWTGVGFKVPSAVWHAGGCVVMDTRHDALSRFFRYPIDLSIIGPSALKELIESLGTGTTHDNCELLVSAGFLPIELAEETVRRVTRRIGILYSSTELAAPPLLSRRGSVDDDIYWLAPAPNRTMRIVDENGNECKTGQEGELRIRLIDVDCKSYLDDEEATAKVFHDQFFSPGDMAVRRADGRVRILGRTEDVLNVRGRKVAVAPIELSIQRMLRVDEVCLFSGLNDAGQDELVVAIQSDAQLLRSALDQIAPQLPPFERVRFEFFKEFPRTATGMRKTQRSVLRKLVFSGHKGIGSIASATGA